LKPRHGAPFEKLHFIGFKIKISGEGSRFPPSFSFPGFLALKRIGGLSGRYRFERSEKEAHDSPKTRRPKGGMQYLKEKEAWGIFMASFSKP